MRKKTRTKRKRKKSQWAMSRHFGTRRGGKWSNGDETLHPREDGSAVAARAAVASS